MTSSRLLCACVLVGLVLCAAARSEAQVYRCLGNRVHLVTDPSSCDSGQAYAVAGARSPIRVSRPIEKGFGNVYDAVIEQAASDYDVRPDLVRAVIQVESGFNPRARSPKGAMGLMQLMPATATELGVRNPFNPAENIRGGVAYLRSLLDRYQDETIALAAYNAGPTAVEKYGNSVPPYRETQQYVDKVQTITAAEPVVGTGAKVLYKTLVLNENGQMVLHFTDTKPSAGPYTIVRR
jgi:soluble lytic murein transglycosylase-like protein